MLNSLKLTEVAPFADCELEFGPRLNLLTGDNGVGKTFLIDLAWTALTRNWPRLESWFDPEGNRQPQIGVRGHRADLATSYNDVWNYSFERQSWILDGAKGSQQDSLSAWSGPVIYLCANGDCKLWDPARDPRAERAPRSEDLFTFEFTPQTLQNGLTHAEGVVCDGLIRDWVSWQRSEAPAFEQLTKVLEVLSDQTEPLRPGPPVRVSVRDVRDFPTLELPYGRVPFHQASAGMQRIASLAYLLVWGWEEHLRACHLRRKEPTRQICLLLDEVESHLHPRWQRLIIPALVQSIHGLTGERIEVQVLASTHAPLVLASVEPSFEEGKDALFHVQLTEDKVKIARLPWYARGEADSWLTSDVFGLDQPRSVDSESAILAAMRAMRQQPDTQEIRAIHHRLRGVLGDTDPFWPRWQYFAEQQGVEP